MKTVLLLRFSVVHGNTTDEWHTNDIWVHTSDIRMTCEYIRVTHGWQTEGIREHTSDIRATHRWHTSDIWVIYRWHPSTYEWHMDDIRVHTSDIRMTYELYMDDMRFERKIKLIFLKLFDNSLSKYLICKIISCIRFLFWVIYQI